MPRDFKIYFSENIKDEVLDTVTQKLNEIYNLNFRVVGLRIPRKDAAGKLEGTYEGRKLLQNMIADGITLFVWIIDSPIAIDDTVVYGHAEPLRGAIITTHSLDYPILVAKLALHYVGIIIGLPVCNEKCVMNRFETLQELIDLPTTLCSTCTLRYKKIKYRFQ